MKTITAAVFALTAAFASGVSLAASGSVPNAEHTGIIIGAETLNWNFIRAGANVQEETGPRMRIGMNWDNFRRRNFGWVYAGEADILVGTTVQEDFNNVPTSERDVSYAGLHAEGIAGIHFGTLIGINVLAGLGFDVTKRALQDPSTGTVLPAADEYWYIVYSKVGAGLSNDFTYGHWRAEGGLKMPLYNHVRVSVEGFDDSGFDPKRRGSLYGQVVFNFGRLSGTHFSLGAYYETFYSGSAGTNVLTVSGVPSATNYTIDKGEAQAVGIKIGYHF